MVLAIGVSLAGSAMLSIGLLRLAAWGPAWLAAWVANDPVKVMRRLMVLAVLPVLPMAIRAAGCIGWRDAAWSRVPARFLDPAWKRDLAAGLGLGILSLGCAVFMSYASGGRHAELFRPAAAFALLLPVTVSALVIGLIEETAVRGFLLNMLRRQWTFWLAALATSVLFAWGHYVEPHPSAFEGEGFWRQVGGVLGSSLSRPSRVPAFLPRFVNLALMGVVLSLSVRRFGTVWMAVGLHAGWVVVKKLNGQLGNIDRSVSTLPWIGQRSDAIDGWLTALLLLALGAAFLCLPSRRKVQSVVP